MTATERREQAMVSTYQSKRNAMGQQSSGRPQVQFIHVRTGSRVVINVNSIQRI